MDYNDYSETDRMIVNMSNTKLKELTKERGLSFVNRKFKSPTTGKMKMVSTAVYTCGSIGSYIRDAETGEYYKYKVGSRDEDFFFKVILATGECKSSNGFSTLFYISPHSYMKHLNVELDPSIIGKWEEKKHNHRIGWMGDRVLED